MAHEFTVEGYAESPYPPRGYEPIPGRSVVAIASLVITPPYRAGPALESVILGKNPAHGFSIREVGSDVTLDGATTYRVTSTSASPQSRQGDFQTMGSRISRLADDPSVLSELENDTPFKSESLPPTQYQRIGR